MNFSNTFDVPYGDLTTKLLGIGSRHARISILCRRSSMRGSCSEEASRTCSMMGLRTKYLVPTGNQLARGETLLRASGESGAVHQVWKTVQNPPLQVWIVLSLPRLTVHLRRMSRSELSHSEYRNIDTFSRGRYHKFEFRSQRLSSYVAFSQDVSNVSLTSPLKVIVPSTSPR